VKLYENAYGTSLMKNIPQPQIVFQGSPPIPPQRPQPQPPKEK